MTQDRTMRPSMGPPGSANAANVSANRAVQWKGKTLGATVSAPAETPPVPPATEVAPQSPGAMLMAKLDRFDEMFAEVSEMHALIVRLSERDTHTEKVFNTLHAELGDYKKDFIYEHLKPVVRPLLFLYDSLEGFEGEIDAFESAGIAPTSAPNMMPTRMVRQNAAYFREQLVEALRICEVTPMDAPEGLYDAKFHKAVQVVPVAREEHNLIVRIVRSGWFLNGQLLRPAEVVVGKHKG